MVTLGPDVIVFGSLFSIQLVWMVLKIFVMRVIDSDRPPRKSSPGRKRAA